LNAPEQRVCGLAAEVGNVVVKQLCQSRWTRYRSALALRAVLEAPAVAARSIISPLTANVGPGRAEMKFSPLLSPAALFIVGRVREDDIPQT
jgi:hypothetical protein